MLVLLIPTLGDNLGNNLVVNKSQQARRNRDQQHNGHNLITNLKQSQSLQCVFGDVVKGDGRAQVEDYQGEQDPVFVDFLLPRLPDVEEQGVYCEWRQNEQEHAGCGVGLGVPFLDHHRVAIGHKHGCTPKVEVPRNKPTSGYNQTAPKSEMIDRPKQVTIRHCLGGMIRWFAHCLEYRVNDRRGEVEEEEMVFVEVCGVDDHQQCGRDLQEGDELVVSDHLYYVCGRSLAITDYLVYFHHVNYCKCSTIAGVRIVDTNPHIGLPDCHEIVRTVPTHANFGFESPAETGNKGTFVVLLVYHLFESHDDQGFVLGRYTCEEFHIVGQIGCRGQLEEIIINGHWIRLIQVILIFLQIDVLLRSIGPMASQQDGFESPGYANRKLANRLFPPLDQQYLIMRIDNTRPDSRLHRNEYVISCDYLGFDSCQDQAIDCLSCVMFQLVLECYQAEGCYAVLEYLAGVLQVFLELFLGDNAISVTDCPVPAERQTCHCFFVFGHFQD